MDVDVEGVEAAESAFAMALSGAGFAVLGIGDDIGGALQDGADRFPREPPRLNQGCGCGADLADRQFPVFPPATLDAPGKVTGGSGP